jgi:hypothetical protein
MSSTKKAEAVRRLETAVKNALYEGLDKRLIEAVVLSALAERA